MDTQAIVPNALQKGDTIAFISPSMRLNLRLPTVIERAKQYFENREYIVKVIFETKEVESYQESVAQRCAEIHEAFGDPTIKAIICTIGGDSVNELLPYLDYQLIRENPKIFCGFSDITLLHFAFLTQSGLQTFYGPTAIPELGVYPEPSKFMMDHFFHVLKDSAGSAIGPLPRSLTYAGDLPNFFFGNEASEKPQELSPSPPWKWLRGGTTTGRIIGGCLSVILKAAGTRFWPAFRGRILFFETAMGEQMSSPCPLDKVRGYIANLINIGIFQEISGLVIGRAVWYDEKMREDLAKLVLEQLHETDFPILMNVDVGHTSPMLTVPLNVLARLDSSNDEFSLLESGVRSH